ncbi:GNAT family N-acetyltransferase [Actinoplanes sp. NPDC026670]|uniref:GNAT family N-acetyltransferase n=1 Tax=Actinoplanes sp. NPDC026670 TaxID=3154700 RepID=UPI0033CE2499
MRIHRDAHGIPHLRAGSVLDLARLQGRVTATDRGRQLQVERLRSEGRLASVAGAAELGWDRFARRVRLDDTARRSFANLDNSTQRWLEAYAEGVRAGGIEWHPWSSLGVFQVQHILFGTFGNKLWRAHVERTLGPAALSWFANEGPGGSGSNAWTVPGQIAGDPHRLLELPGIYQQIRLACPAFDVAGLTFPGVPGVQHFGHAGSVAWAITNAMADYQDLYLEELREVDGRLQARGATGWEPVVTHQETILVRDEDPVVVDIIETARGPVIDGNLSLRTPARSEFDLGFDALLPLLHASTVDDVADALSRWVEPVNSVLTADSTGRARQLTVGRVPQRDDRNRLVPVPAWEARHAWQPEWAPMFSSEVTTAVNANDRRPDTAPHGVDFAPPARARRIRELLDLGVPPEKIHMDTSLPADSADAGRRMARQAALARAVCDRPELQPLFEPSGYDPLFAPWTDPRARIGIALDGVLAGLGLDPAALVPSPAPASSPSSPPGPASTGPASDVPWGARHLLYPLRLPGLDAVVPQIELGGSAGCVLNTSSVPGVSDLCWRGPVARYVWDLTDRSRSRWVVPFGASDDPSSPHFLDQLPLWASGELVPLVTDWELLTEEPVTVFAEKLPGLGELTMIRLAPATHAPVVHSWVIKERNRFWGMAEHSVADVEEIYRFVDGLDSHHAYLLLLDGEPIGVFQTYEPSQDPVGECYDVRPGDFGLHLLLDASGRELPHLTSAVFPALLRHLFAEPGRRRIVAEPDIRNDRMISRLQREGFTLGAEIDLGHKKAQLTFLERDRFEGAEG